jgi:hypothetical protein
LLVSFQTIHAACSFGAASAASAANRRRWGSAALMRPNANSIFASIEPYGGRGQAPSIGATG